MEYRRNKYLGEHSIDEVFEGTPQEILELMNGMGREDDELIYDIDKAVEYIDQNIIGVGGNAKDIIIQVLELEEDYMRSIGIIGG